MKPQYELATSLRFGTRPFYALLPSVLSAFIGDRRKHQPNPRTGPDHSSGNLTANRFPDAVPAMLSPFKTHSSRLGFLQVAVSEAPVHSISADAFSFMGASDTALRLLARNSRELRLTPHLSSPYDAPQLPLFVLESPKPVLRA